MDPLFVAIGSAVIVTLVFVIGIATGYTQGYNDGTEDNQS